LSRTDDREGDCQLRSPWPGPRGFGVDALEYTGGAPLVTGQQKSAHGV